MLAGSGGAGSREAAIARPRRKDRPGRVRRRKTGLRVDLLTAASLIVASSSSGRAAAPQAMETAVLEMRARMRTEEPADAVRMEG